MTKRGKRAREKKEYQPRYPGGLIIPTEKQREAMEKEAAENERKRNSKSKFKSATGKGKEATLEVEDDVPEEYQCVQHSLLKKKRKVDASEMVALTMTCPLLSKMSEWSPAEYQAYDEYLVKKWKSIGWDPKDAGYLSIRDRNARVARIARDVYKQP